MISALRSVLRWPKPATTTTAEVHRLSPRTSQGAPWRHGAPILLSGVDNPRKDSVRFSFRFMISLH
jgi:hypothetical protein